MRAANANAVWPVVWGICFIGGIIIGSTGPGPVRVQTFGLSSPNLRGSERAAQKPFMPESTVEIEVSGARHDGSEGSIAADLQPRQQDRADAKAHDDAAAATAGAYNDAVAAAAASAPANTAHNDAVAVAAAAAAAAAPAADAAAAPAAPSTALTPHRALGRSEFAADFPDERLEEIPIGFDGLWRPDEGEVKETSKELALIREEDFMALHAPSAP